MDSTSRRSLLVSLATVGAGAAAPPFTPAIGAPAGNPVPKPLGECIDCRDFAELDPGGSTACDAAINAAISAGIAHHLPVYLPRGTYRIDNPLIANPLARRQGYVNLQFCGAGGLGSLDPIGASSRAQTVIAPTFRDRPAIAMDLMSGAVFRDFAIKGVNTAPDAITAPMDRAAAYIGPGCRNNRYSPYCAIAIDAFNNPDIAEADRYPGMSSHYFKSSGGSVGLTIQNVWIANFVVGIAYGISGYVANTEDILFDNLWISRVDTCYAVGHTQARHCLMRMGNLAFARQGIDGYSHGDQTGCPPKFERVNHGFLYRIFSVPNWVGNFVLDDNYAESIRTLGNYGWGAGYSRQPLSFIGGDYTITSIDNGFGPPPPLLLETYSPTVFKGTGITRDANAASVDALNIVSADTVCSFEQCFLPGSGTARVPPFIGLVKDTSHVQVRLIDCYAASGNGGELTLSDSVPRSYGIAAFASGGRYSATYQTRWVTDGNREYLYMPHESDNVQCAVAVTDLELSTEARGLCTFNTSDAHILVGDILFWIMMPQGNSRNQWAVPAMKVRSIQGKSVRCDLLFEARQYDSVEKWNRNNAGQMFIAVRQWAPAQPLTCDMHGSTMITALSAASILIGNGPGVAGDWIAGAGIPPNTRVVSVDRQAATAVLSQPTRGAPASGVPVYFGRLHAVAMDPAF